MRRMALFPVVLCLALAAPAAAWATTINFSFLVPAPPYNKTTNQGWGFLVLTFDRPIEGGSFVFLPDCSDPLDGVLSLDEMSIRLGPGSYGLGATGAPSVGANAPTPYGTLDVTIEYDPDEGVPVLQFGTGVSYWKAKRADFVYTPQSSTVTKNYDIPLTEQQIVPEPATLLPTLFGLALTATWLRRRRQP